MYNKQSKSSNGNAIFPKSKSSDNFFASEFMFVREAKFGKKGKDGELECEENEKGDAKKSFSGNGRNRLPVSHNASKDEGREKSKID